MNRRRTDNKITTKKKDEVTKNDPQYTKQKTKVTGPKTPLKAGDEYGCFGRVGSSCYNIKQAIS